ncbi:MAG: nickel pincer cofactor biosynthesis protein LarC [Clostridiales bacterium]|jgi:uncharacterized protein (TIGR00299 family) protein|nr:nickel pincer cofactor biosynthesis protein LarC [Clostridiales bacterium]
MHGGALPGGETGQFGAFMHEHGHGFSNAHDADSGTGTGTYSGFDSGTDSGTGTCNSFDSGTDSGDAILRSGHAHAGERTLSDIVSLIDGSDLNGRVKDLSKKVFREIAEAEGSVHGVPAERVHFHEVGALDSIVDIVGVCICVDMLGADAIFSSALHEGRGFVNTRHGRLPVPVPAVIAMLGKSGIPFISEDVNSELITPTGIGLVKTFAKGFGQMPPMRVDSTGYGFGKRDIGRLNALRVVLGEAIGGGVAAGGGATHAGRAPSATGAASGATSGPRAAGAAGAAGAASGSGAAGAAGIAGATGAAGAQSDGAPSEILMIEANIDDMTAEALGYAMDRLFAHSALDVFFTPIYMKKNRPATKLTVLAAHEDAETLIDVLFKETTTLGVRKIACARDVMARRTETVGVPPYGDVRVKVASRKDVTRISPEYDDCRLIAEKSGLPILAVYETVRANMP